MTAGPTVRGMRLGDGTTRVIVPLTGDDPAALLAEASAVAAAGPDLVEWRIDPLLAAGGSLEVGSRLRAMLGDLPLLVTLRTTAEGGRFPADDYPALVRAAARYADLVDVELARPGATELIADLSASVPVVASRHHFDRTPDRDELVDTLDRMLATQAAVAKIAVMPRTPADLLTLLAATDQVHARADRPLITIAMGRLGAITRIGGGVFGSAATFATVGASSAPGQLPLAEVRAALRLVEGR